MKRRLLLVEDDQNIAAALRSVLEAEGYALTHADRGERGLELATSQRFDVVLSDLKMPGLSGLELVQQLHHVRPQLPLILMTAHGTADTAITATKNGAYDYLLKPFEMDELLAVLDKAIESSRLAAQPISIGEGEASLDAIIGQSRAMQEIYKEIGRIAAKPVSVLIRGATGTGKELIARAIYQHSDRAGRPFIAVNCTAIPENLLESELFGHEKGAFTGAEVRRIGRLEQAHTGTILLDEIGDMPLPAQVKLLRFLQERTIERVGGREIIPIDVRVLAATHRDLEAAIVAQQFREDLFYRLNVVTITLPPLRQRADDIPGLVHYFLRRHGTEFGLDDVSIQAEALRFLAEQPWPGNVRELENVVRKALLSARGFGVGLAEARAACAAAHLSPAIAQPFAQSIGDLLVAASRGELQDLHATVLADAERELLAQAIKLAEGNQAKAARWLGISRLTLREKLTAYGLHPAQTSRPELSN